jgi:hypothetical protein
MGCVQAIDYAHGENTLMTKTRAHVDGEAAQRGPLVAVQRGETANDSGSI